MTHHADHSHDAPVIRVSDELWEAVRPILDEHDPPRRLGRKRIDQRRALDAIAYRARSGCRWNNLPKVYPDDSSVHRTYQRWQRLGILDRVLALIGEGTPAATPRHAEPTYHVETRTLQAAGVS